MLDLQPVERRSGLTRETFAAEYLEPLKPVVFTDLTAGWPAIRKWTIEYFKEKYGDLMVPVVSNNFSRPGKGYLAADKHITFREYLEILESGPSDLRIFAWNIFWKAPELREDFAVHDIMDGFVNELPFLFFGCEGSRVTLHYDVDMSHVFLNQIHGRKRVILFSPEQGRHLYHLPFTVASHVNILKPDYEKYPALQHVKGQEVMLQPGETLFIPRGYWHNIEYTDGGYSISLRSFDSILYRVQGLASITKNYAVDRLMNRFMGQRWYNMKVRMAERRAEEVMQEEIG
ncbi:MAG: cupin-like domain-containing protein [Saprospiraceae bacterium]|nr:cupin-like domain-containing protein [Saprospiraceae bacterium]